MAAHSHWVLGLVVMAAAAPVDGQVDYRNLDDGRPTRVEDATGVELFAFELLWSYGFEQEKQGGVAHVMAPELSYGLFPRLHVGLKLPFAHVREPSANELGLAGFETFAFYNVGGEGVVLPAFSLRVDGSFPVGRFSGTETSMTFKGIATRSYGLMRAHVNAAVRVGRDGDPGRVHSPANWWTGVAVDRTLFRESLLLVGETWLEKLGSEDGVALNAGAGLRWQWTPTMVFDLGVSRGFAKDLGPALGLRMGFSYVFGIRGLMPQQRSEAL